MIKKLEISYLKGNKEKDELNKISEILSEGIYEYLKKKGLLKENHGQKVKIEKILSRIKNTKNIELIDQEKDIK